MGIERFSSRRQALGPVLSERLADAKLYLRITGYFRSSLLEVVGEALDTVQEIKVACNGDLDPFDVKVAKAARDGSDALARTTTEDGLDILLARKRYRRLHDLLASGRMKVRVVPRDTENVFVHGKAGPIEHENGRVYAFAGSVNDSATALRHAYEILWGDNNPAAALWVQEEFEHFWTQGIDLPDAVIKHVEAMANRVEYRSIEAARDPAGVIQPDAVLAERPIYKGGQILRPRQKRCVQTCIEDWKLYGKARYLIADDVGLGKTLSMAAAPLVLSLLDNRPVLILAPATLVWQWQEELEDKLGIPAAVWSTQKKCWLDGERRALMQKGDSIVAKCPWRIGIVSTGLVVNGDDGSERGALAKQSFGVIILDEAHKARAIREKRGGQTTAKRNNLLEFLHKAARSAGSVIFGTATPIQLNAVELWDLLAALNQGASQVLGKTFDGGEWLRDESIEFLTGSRPWPQNETSRWGLFRNPLPPSIEHEFFRDLRQHADIPVSEVVGPRFDDLSPDFRQDLRQLFDDLTERHNPIVRRVVRRTRPMLEEKGLLKRIGVIVHPRADDGLPGAWFDGQGLFMGPAFTAAYDAAETFSKLYAARCPDAGFLKTILLRRIGSSARAGLETARHLLTRIDAGVIPEDEIGDEDAPTDDTPPVLQETQLLGEVERNLAAVVAGSDADPKVQVILHYLNERGWRESNGATIFSQYLTTAESVLEALCAEFPDEPVALYAGGAASFVQQGNDRKAISREQIKSAIQRGDIRLVCATDAACEGLNLQRLGAQINVDLPWNPSRLEQRKGRVQRIGQTRDNVHVLNLRYSGTVEDDVYAALSDRFGDIFSVLGQLPDGFEDEWIQAVLHDRQAVQNFSQHVEKTKPAMELRYLRDVADDQGLDWEYTERVLSSRDLDEWMRQGW
jgi:superfamily II DNA or RNA helicase